MDASLRGRRGLSQAVPLALASVLLAGACATDPAPAASTMEAESPRNVATGTGRDVATLEDLAGRGLDDGERLELIARLAQDEPALTLYSSANREVTERWVESFMRRFPGVDVEYVVLETEELTLRLAAEAAAARRTADVVFTSTPVLGELVGRGELLPHHGTIVPDQQLRDLAHPAVNLIRLETQVIAWATGWRAASDGPRSLDDLLRSEFSGCVHTGSPTWVSLLIQQRGEQQVRAWFEGFLANGGVMAESTSRQLRRLGAGEIDCLVLGRETTLQRLVEDGASIVWTVPEPATTLSHGVGILAGTRSPFAAALLALWVAQPEQVITYLEEAGGVGLHPGLADVAGSEEALVDLERLRRDGYLVLDLDTAGELAPVTFELLAEYYTPNLIGP